MKSDKNTTILNFLLGALVLLGVYFTLIGIWHTHKFQQLTYNAPIANNTLLRAQGLANDAAAYNVSAKSPELTRILQSVQPKPATK